MSQVNSYDRESYTTNGVAKSFSFGWNVNSKDDVKIQFVNAKGEIVDTAKFIDANNDEYTTSTYNFTVELNRQGGQIIFVDTPAEDQYLIIYRQTPLVYENSFKTATAFPAAAIDAAYRKIWLAIQEISADSLYNTLRLTPDQRGTVLDAFSDGDNNSFIYYDSISNKLTYTDFKIQDVENALVYVSQIPSIASDASEALNKANNAIIIANNAKSESELAMQDASNAIQAVNGKQDKLVSGVNIKTINGQSVLGSGDLTVTAVASWGSIVGDINDQTDLQNALNDKANTTDLATVATTGDYDDLINKPTIPSAQIQSDWTQADSSAVDYIKNKPSLSTVATSGDYDDLINKPTLGTAAAANTTDFATAAQGSKADTAIQPSDLATVATTGSYNDLLNKPTIPAAQVNSDWAANSGVAEILNKPTLGTMAAESASDYTPTANLATVATSGLYSDLSGTPTIPTTLAGLTGDVSISSPSNGDYLVYNSTSQKWENTASAATVSWGNITGTLADQTDLQTALNTFVTKGHEVIAFQEPNVGNNYTWYRKYADGWVEQGGIIAQATSAEVNLNFPVIMADTNYGWGLNISYNDTNPTGGRLVSAWNFTTTGMTARCDTNFKKYWRVEGMAA